MLSLLGRGAGSPRSARAAIGKAPVSARERGLDGAGPIKKKSLSA
jgi:hypothetical protein